MSVLIPLNIAKYRGYKRHIIYIIYYDPLLGKIRSSLFRTGRFEDRNIYPSLLLRNWTLSTKNIDG